MREAIQPSSLVERWHKRDRKVGDIAAVELEEYLETAMTKETFARVHQPVLTLYYYKNEQQQDPVVRVSAIKRMMDELREIAGTDAPAFADEGGAAVASLADVLTAAHHARQIGGRNPASPEDIEASCRRLAEALNKERQEVIDDLRYRPVPVVGNSQLAGRDININAGGHVSVGGRDAAQHIQGLDIVALLALMSQLQEEIEAAQIADDKRDELLDQMEDIQATARRPKADPSLLKDLATKLWSGVKAVGIPVSTEVAAAYAKVMLGL